jgi:hypothetical protein
MEEEETMVIEKSEHEKVKNSIKRKTMNEFQKTMFQGYQLWATIALNLSYSRKDAAIFRSLMSFFDKDWNLDTMKQI